MMAEEHNFLDCIFLKDLADPIYRAEETTEAFYALKLVAIEDALEYCNNCDMPMVEIVCPHCEKQFWRCQQCGNKVL